MMSTRWSVVMAERPATFWVGLAMISVLPVVAQSQTVSQSLTLNVNGHQAQVPITQMNGHSYVEVQALARAANGTISYQGNAMQLSFPGSGVDAQNAEQPSAPAAAQPAPQNVGFSKGFMTAAIEAMAEVREWRSVLTNGVANGYPIANLGLGNYRAQAAQSLRLAGVAVSTDSDQQAMALITNEFENMRKLSDKYLASAQNMNYIEPDSVAKDPLDKQIIGCARSLSAMAASGQFYDDGSCH